jgi:hypothetical protein
MKAGRFRVTAFDTRRGDVLSTREVAGQGALIFETPPIAADLAFAVTPAG